jgi:glycosyltransferase involved in cell wall biosynthesis
MDFKMTIIVPLFNEMENLKRVEEELSKFLPEAIKKSCVLFVDDGSTDGSLKMVKEICTRHKSFHYIAFEKNQGLSAAIKAGFDYVETPLVGYIDSDLQTDPEDFNLLLEKSDEYDLVTGVRVERKDSFKKNLSSRVANGIRNAFTHDGMDDTGCPLKVIKSDVAKRIPMFKGLHRFLPAMVNLQKGTTIQIPVRHYPRIAGTPKYFLLNRLVGPFVDCFAYLWMKNNYINYKVQERDE